MVRETSKVKQSRRSGSSRLQGSAGYSKEVESIFRVLTEGEEKSEEAVLLQLQELSQTFFEQNLLDSGYYAVFSERLSCLDTDAEVQLPPRKLVLPECPKSLLLTESNSIAEKYGTLLIKLVQTSLQAYTVKSTKTLSNNESSPAHVKRQLLSASFGIVVLDRIRRSLSCAELALEKMLYQVISRLTDAQEEALMQTNSECLEYLRVLQSSCTDLPEDSIASFRQYAEKLFAVEWRYAKQESESGSLPLSLLRSAISLLLRQAACGSSSGLDMALEQVYRFGVSYEKQHKHDLKAYENLSVFYSEIVLELHELSLRENKENKAQSNAPNSKHSFALFIVDHKQYYKTVYTLNKVLNRPNESQSSRTTDIYLAWIEHASHVALKNGSSAAAAHYASLASEYLTDLLDGRKIFHKREIVSRDLLMSRLKFVCLELYYSSVSLTETPQQTLKDQGISVEKAATGLAALGEVVESLLSTGDAVLERNLPQSSIVIIVNAIKRLLKVGSIIKTVKDGQDRLKALFLTSASRVFELMDSTIEMLREGDKAELRVSLVGLKVSLLRLSFSLLVGDRCELVTEDISDDIVAYVNAASHTLEQLGNTEKERGEISGDIRSIGSLTYNAGLVFYRSQDYTTALPLFEASTKLLEQWCLYTSGVQRSQDPFRDFIDAFVLPREIFESVKLETKLSLTAACQWEIGSWREALQSIGVAASWERRHGGESKPDLLEIFVSYHVQAVLRQVNEDTSPILSSDELERQETQPILPLDSPSTSILSAHIYPVISLVEETLLSALPANFHKEFLYDLAYCYRSQRQKRQGILYMNNDGDLVLSGPSSLADYPGLMLFLAFLEMELQLDSMVAERACPSPASSGASSLSVGCRATWKAAWNAFKCLWALAPVYHMSEKGSGEEEDLQVWTDYIKKHLEMLQAQIGSVEKKGSKKALKQCTQTEDKHVWEGAVEFGRGLLEYFCSASSSADDGLLSFEGKVNSINAAMAHFQTALDAWKHDHLFVREFATTEEMEAADSDVAIDIRDVAMLIEEIACLHERHDLLSDALEVQLTLENTFSNLQESKMRTLSRLVNARRRVSLSSDSRGEGHASETLQSLYECNIEEPVSSFTGSLDQAAKRWNRLSNSCQGWPVFLDLLETDRENQNMSLEEASTLIKHHVRAMSAVKGQSERASCMAQTVLHLCRERHDLTGTQDASQETQDRHFVEHPLQRLHLLTEMLKYGKFALPETQEADTKSGKTQEEALSTFTKESLHENLLPRQILALRPLQQTGYLGVQPLADILDIIEELGLQLERLSQPRRALSVLALGLRTSHCLGIPSRTERFSEHISSIYSRKQVLNKAAQFAELAADCHRTYETQRSKSCNSACQDSPGEDALNNTSGDVVRYREGCRELAATEEDSEKAVYLQLSSIGVSYRHLLSSRLLESAGHLHPLRVLLSTADVNEEDELSNTLSDLKLKGNDQNSSLLPLIDPSAPMHLSFKAFQQAVRKVDDEWVICSLSIARNGSLVITRTAKDKPSLYVSIESKDGERSAASIMKEFHEVMERNRETLSKEVLEQASRGGSQLKTRWWNERKQLDKRLELLLDDFQNGLLRHWRILLLPECPSAWLQSADVVADVLKTVLGGPKNNGHPAGSSSMELVRQFLVHGSLLTAAEKRAAISDVADRLHLKCDDKRGKLEAIMLGALKGFSQSEKQEEEGPTTPVDLPLLTPAEVKKMKVADLRKELIARGLSASDNKPILVQRLLDWITRASASSASSSDDRQSQSTNSLGCTVLVLDEQLQAFPVESIPCLRTTSIARVPAVHFLLLHLLAREEGAHRKATRRSIIEDGARLDNSSFVINPDGDLVNTEQTLLELTNKLFPKGNGLIGRPPSSEKMREFLESSDLFLYCGHGGGEQYLHRDKVMNLPSSAVSLLVGCSSGHLKPDGCYDPSGIAIGHLVAKSPAVIANLWDVTDKDIDKLCTNLLESWTDNMKTVAKKDLAPLSSSLLDSLHPARDTCKLKFLNGASAIYYGFPHIYQAE